LGCGIYRFEPEAGILDSEKVRLLRKPIPASIYGMSLLFLLLMTGVLKLQQVENAANLLLGIMPALFVVSGAGLITSYGQIAEHFFGWVAVNIGSTIVILATTGLLAQVMIRRKKAKEADGND